MTPTPFTSAADARDVGGPLLRLHRAALGRDPDFAGLAALVAAWRRGVRSPELSRVLAGTDEFCNVHGPGSPDDSATPATAARIAIQAFRADDPSASGLAAAMAGLSRAEVVAAIAEAAPVRARSPLLPGLFPDVPPDDPVAYAFWVAAHDTPSPGDLARLPPLAGPRVSLAMLAGDSETEAALRTLESLQAGAYQDWEICLATRLHSAWPQRVLSAAAAAEPRLRLVPNGRGGAATDALNAALAACAGTVVGIVAPGDTLPPTGLYEAVQAWTARPGVRMLYTDEDQADLAGQRTAPRFKPAYSADAHRGGIPVGRLALHDAALLAQVGGLRAGPDPEHNLALRAAAAAGAGAVVHVPAVLCHRAAAPPFPAALPGPALADPLPGVTVILLTRDRPDLLAASTAGVLHGTDYPAVELLVVDNGSTDPGALALLDDLAADPRVRVLRRPGPFNFSALNNAAAREARGAVLVLLNNDTEMPDRGWLRALVRHAMRPDVGLVGARLLYRDGTLQHGGMVLGPLGQATHVLRGAPRDAPGYEGQLACTRDLSAVTGACIALRREAWDAVGGMDEGLPVAWNDVDLCQRVRAAGLRVLWTPDAVLLHLEGETRGLDADDPARMAGFLADAARYRATWGAAADEDPFLNPNLAATDHALVLAPPRHPRPWQTQPAAGAHAA